MSNPQNPWNNWYNLNLHFFLVDLYGKLGKYSIFPLIFVWFLKEKSKRFLDSF